MAVDDAGYHHAARDVVFDRPLRRGQLRPTDGDDGAALHNQDAGIDWRTGYRQNPPAAKDVRLVLRGRRRMLQRGQDQADRDGMETWPHGGSFNCTPPPADGG